MKPCNRVPEWREINAKDEKNPELLAQTDRQTIGPAWTRKFFSLFFFPQIYLIRRKLSPLVLFASVWMGRLFVMLPLISNFMKGTWRWWRGEWGWWRGWGWGRGLRMPRMVWPGQSRGDPSLPGDPDGIDYHYTLCTVHTLYHTGVFQNSKSISNPFLLLVCLVTIIS